MMTENGILRENERQANKIAAKVMRITFIIFTLVYLLNVFRVFVVDDVIMTIAYIGGGLLLLLPTLLTDILKLDKELIKYINVFAAAVFVTLLCTTLTYHVVVIYVYPIAIASLYFSKKLNILATCFTVVGVSVGQFLAFYLHTLQDDNFTEILEDMTENVNIKQIDKDTTEYSTDTFMFNTKDFEGMDDLRKDVRKTNLFIKILIVIVVLAVISGVAFIILH